MHLGRAGVVVAATVVVLTGCGGSSDAKQRREAVNTYFDRVDRAQADLRSAAGEIDRAYRNFRPTGNSASELRALVFARGRVATALERVRAVKPPTEARRIHGELLQLLTLQHDAAVELLWIARYQPRLEHALVPLSAAGTTLAADIRTAAKRETPPGRSSASDRLGAAVFVRAGCGKCHSLSATGSTGTSGPNLDALRLTAAQIGAIVRTGGGGMPAYAKRIAPRNIDALASFVAGEEARQAANGATLDAYGAAFRRYHDTLQGVADELNRLRAPPVLRPTLLAERRTLGRAAALSDSVAASLKRRDLDAANAAIRELFNVAASADEATTRRSAADAVHAYNERLKQIAVVAARITRDRQRLVNEIG
jgi:mono/diheme cytochrome c family protein